MLRKAIYITFPKVFEPFSSELLLGMCMKSANSSNSGTYYGEDYVYCDFCRRLVPKDKTEEFGIKHYCSKCHKLLFKHCDQCRQEVEIRHAVLIEKSASGGVWRCHECFDDTFIYCYRCRKLIARRTAKEHNYHQYCADCHEQVSLEFIMDYSEKPEPVFHFMNDDAVVKTNKLWEKQNLMRFIGVELETSTKVDFEKFDVENIAKNICETFGGPESMYAKHDGTIGDLGIEFVSMPMTLEAHMHAEWESILKSLQHIGYTSHDARCCGLHCHVNRTCFGSAEDQQNKNITKVLKLYLNMKEPILAFSRRTEDQIDNCAEHITAPEWGKESLYDHTYSRGRRLAVNVTNDATVEFRIFNGTLRYQTFIATLQFVDETVRIAIQSSEKKINNLSWNDLVEKELFAYRELNAYLKERGLKTQQGSAEPKARARR